MAENPCNYARVIPGNSTGMTALSLPEGMISTRCYIPLNRKWYLYMIPSGICRGAQLLNARRGGNLYQELRSQRRRTSNRRTVLPLKTLDIVPGSRLADLFGTERAQINSLHNQAINQLGQQLQVSGRDLDGIIQSIEDPEHPFLIGVQWHPEFLLLVRRQRHLFQALITAAKKHP